MNKKIVIGISTGILASALGLGGTVYMVQSNLETRQEIINKNIENFTKNLPSQVKLEKGSVESDLFETNGSYALKYNEPNNKEYNGEITVSYHLEHGFDSWFGGDIPFTATAKINGNIKKSLQIKNDVLSNMTGTIKENGSFSLEQKSDNFTFIIPKPNFEEENSIPAAELKVDPVVVAPATESKLAPAAPIVVAPVTKSEIKDNGTLVSINGISGKVEFDNETGNLKNHYTYNELTIQNIETNVDKITIKNIKGSYSSNLNNLDSGSINIKADSLINENESFKLEGIDSLVSVENKNNKTNMKFNAKINKINFMEQKDAAVEFGYSVNGLDNKIIQLYKKVIEVYSSGKEFNDKDYLDARGDLVNGLKSGMSFSLDTFKFKNLTNMFNLNAKLELKPTENGKSFSFSSQTKFLINVDSEGDFSQAVSGFIDSNQPNESTTTEPIIPTEPVKKYTFNSIYENGLLKLNGESSKPEINNSINEALRNIDLKWGFIVVEKPVDNIEVKPEVSEEKK